MREYESTLVRYQNVHTLHLRQVLLDGGPWASPVLQAILVEGKLPQEEVDRYIDSELPVHLELRVRYLLSCGQALEAMALVKCCFRHPKARQHLFFLQTYLTWLCKGSHHHQLDKEIAEIDGDDAVAIICNMEGHETDELLLTLSRAFLSQQLRFGSMHYLWDLVFIWSQLFRRVNPAKQAFLKETKELLLSATNVKSIFLFMRVVLTEIGAEGIQLCVELCANALQSSPPCEPQTKSHLYKTIASLLPEDLEVCRACTLLAFFTERSLEAYRTVFLLYTHPDQEYNADTSPVGNHVRFEILQVLKKGLYFDPEFFNLMNLRTNCLKLMSEKVMTSALEEVIEDVWEPNHWTKEAQRLQLQAQRLQLQAQRLQLQAQRLHLQAQRLHFQFFLMLTKMSRQTPLCASPNLIMS
ncbi:zinc finger protein 654-like [Aplochiton taeniatus]